MEALLVALTSSFISMIASSAFVLATIRLFGGK